MKITVDTQQTAWYNKGTNKTQHEKEKFKMTLYLAVDIETKAAFIFNYYEEFKSFAKENMYSFNYYKIGNTEEFTDYRL